MGHPLLPGLRRSQPAPQDEVGRRGASRTRGARRTDIQSRSRLLSNGRSHRSRALPGAPSRPPRPTRPPGAKRPPSVLLLPSPSGDRLILRRLSPAEARCNDRQPEQRDRVVVGRDAILALDAAAVASMNHHLFPLRSEAGAAGRHQRPAATGPIAWSTLVNVAGGETERAMIAVPAARDGWADKRPAPPALERFLTIGADPAQPRLAPVRPASRPAIAAAAGPGLIVSMLGAGPGGVVLAREPVDRLAMKSWHGRDPPLRCGC